MNASLSPEANEVIKRAIKELEAELQAALDSLEQAKARVNYITEQLKEHRSLIAPMRKLPVELLSELFVLASRIEDLAPVKITEVCRLWRQVILVTPQAWSRIWFDNSLSPERSHRYVSTFLKRSNPIQLHIRLPPEFDPSYYSMGFSLHSILYENLHRIQCLTASGWQVARLNLVTLPNVRQISFTKGTGERIRPSDINVSTFPQLEAIDSLCALWLNLAAPSPDRFPNLLRLSLSVDMQSAWLEIIQCAASTLESLILWGRQEYDVPEDFAFDLPALKSLEILDFPYNKPWAARIKTPSLVSYRESRIQADLFISECAAITSHPDVGSVTHLHTDIVPELSRFPALQVLGLQIPSESTRLLSSQFKENGQLCPFLEKMELILDSSPKEAFIDFKRELCEVVEDAKRDIKVLFTTERRLDMPFDLVDTLVSMF